jgi:hypothetical protein
VFSHDLQIHDALRRDRRASTIPRFFAAFGCVEVWEF